MKQDRHIATFRHFKSVEVSAAKGLTANFRKIDFGKKGMGNLKSLLGFEPKRGDFWRFGRKSLFCRGLGRNEIAEGCYEGERRKMVRKL